eukprot:2139414-Pyramimonas_sp.AAC.1
MARRGRQLASETRNWRVGSGGWRRFAATANSPPREGSYTECRIPPSPSLRHPNDGQCSPRRQTRRELAPW